MIDKSKENNPFFEKIEEHNEKIGFIIGFFIGLCFFAVLFQIYMIKVLFSKNYMLSIIVFLIMIIEIFMMRCVYKILRSKER